MDIITLDMAKSFAKKQISVGIKSIAFVDPNIFSFTLVNDSVINVAIPDLNNFSDIEKAKLVSLDETLLNRFSYVGELLFDGQPIISNSSTLTNYTVGFGGVIPYTIGYISNSDTIVTASSNNITHCNKVVGFILESKLQGEQVKVQSQGEIVNTSWNLTSGDSYYLGLGGNITNITPTSGFIQKIGIAKNPTTLLIKLDTPIKLM